LNVSPSSTSTPIDPPSSSVGVSETSSNLPQVGGANPPSTHANTETYTTSSSTPIANDPTVPTPIPFSDSPFLPSNNGGEKFKRDGFPCRTPNRASQTSSLKTNLELVGVQGASLLHDNSIPALQLQPRQVPVPTTIIRGSNICVIIPQAPYSDPFTTESLTTPTQYDADGVGTSTEVIARNPVIQFATAALVTVTDYDSNNQPTATRTLNPITSIVQFNSQSQAASIIFINDPVITQTFYDTGGRPTSTRVMNAQLTTVTYYDSKGGIVSTKIVAVTESSLSGDSISTHSTSSSASKSKQNTSSSSTMITVVQDPQTAFPPSSTSSPSKSEGRSITKSEFRISFWIGILNGFIFAAWL